MEEPSSDNDTREVTLGCGTDMNVQSITLNITTTTGGSFQIVVGREKSVEDLKKIIGKKLKVVKDRLCLLHRERELQDGTTLKENGLTDESKIILIPTVETGLLAQRPENTVMQALESLNDSQVNDFLSGKTPLNLSMRLGDHMMLIQLQLSTVNSTSTSPHCGTTSSSLLSSIAAQTSSRIKGNIQRPRLATASVNSEGVSTHVKSGLAPSKILKQIETKIKDEVVSAQLKSHIAKMTQTIQSPTLVSVPQTTSSVKSTISTTRPSISSVSASSTSASSSALPSPSPSTIASSVTPRLQRGLDDCETLGNFLESLGKQGVKLSDGETSIAEQSPIKSLSNLVSNSTNQRQLKRKLITEEKESIDIESSAAPTTIKTAAASTMTTISIPPDSTSMPTNLTNGDNANSYDDKNVDIELPDPISANLTSCLCKSLDTNNMNNTTDIGMHHISCALCQSQDIDIAELANLPSFTISKDDILGNALNDYSTLTDTSLWPEVPSELWPPPASCTQPPSSSLPPSTPVSPPPTPLPPAQPSSSPPPPQPSSSPPPPQPSSSPHTTTSTPSDINLQTPLTLPSKRCMHTPPLVKRLRNRLNRRAYDDNVLSLIDLPASSALAPSAHPFIPPPDQIIKNLPDSHRHRVIHRQSILYPTTNLRRNLSASHTSPFARPSTSNNESQTTSSFTNYLKESRINGKIIESRPSSSSSSSVSPSLSVSSATIAPTSSSSKSTLPQPPMEINSRALAEASRNLTQTLRKLSKEVFTNKIELINMNSQRKCGTGAVIESMKNHGKGIYSGTFSGTLNPALQDRYGRPKRDISTVIHILNDLLSATPHYRRNSRHILEEALERTQVQKNSSKDHFCSSCNTLIPRKTMCNGGASCKHLTEDCGAINIYKEVNLATANSTSSTAIPASSSTTTTTTTTAAASSTSVSSVPDTVNPTENSNKIPVCYKCNVQLENDKTKNIMSKLRQAMQQNKQKRMERKLRNAPYNITGTNHINTTTSSDCNSNVDNEGNNIITSCSSNNSNNTLPLNLKTTEQSNVNAISNKMTTTASSEMIEIDKETVVGKIQSLENVPPSTATIPFILNKITDITNAPITSTSTISTTTTITTTTTSETATPTTTTIETETAASTTTNTKPTIDDPTTETTVTSLETTAPPSIDGVVGTDGENNSSSSSSKDSATTNIITSEEINVLV